MVTKKQLKDWNNKVLRETQVTKIEKYIDEAIKKTVLQGTKVVFISSGYPDNVKRCAAPNKFYELWCDDQISRDNLNEIRRIIIEKYTKAGFEVYKKVYDEGWNSSFEGLLIKIPSQMFKD